MKKLFFISILIFFATSVFAQKNSEFGITRTGILFGDYGLTYKKQLNDNKYRRFEFVNEGSSIFNFANAEAGFSLKTGKEKRGTRGGKRWESTRGVMYGARFSNFNEKSQLTLTPNIGLAMGLQRNLGSHFGLRAEVTPTAGYAFDLAKNSVSGGGIRLGVPVTVSFIYRH